MNRFLIPLTLLIAASAIPDVAHAASRPGDGSHAQRSAQHGSRSGGKASGKADRKSSGKADRNNSRKSPERAAPERDAPERTAPERADSRSEAGGTRPRAANEASPARQPVTRSVDLGGAHGQRSPASGAHHPNAAPSNYRAKPAQSHNQRHNPREAVQHRAAATARSHSVAARGHAHGRAHGRTATWHRNYAAARNHYSWYQSRGWFTRWAPGRPHHWYHGVFVYGPAPWSPPPPSGHSRASVPERSVSHAGDLTIGLRGSSYTSGYKAGAPYSDLGLGVAARYRFVDALGLEVQWVYHDDTWSQGTQRIEQPLSASLQLFAMPWARVNPYLVAGLTVTQRNVQDKVGPTFVEENRAAVGPHIGLGIDFNLSEHTSLSLDGRYLAYANIEPNDAARAGALQGNLGLNFSF